MKPKKTKRECLIELTMPCMAQVEETEDELLFILDFKKLMASFFEMHKQKAVELCCKVKEIKY